MGQDTQNQLVEAGHDGSVLPNGEWVPGVGTTETRNQLSWVEPPHSNSFIGLTCEQHLMIRIHIEGILSFLRRLLKNIDHVASNKNMGCYFYLKAPERIDQYT